MISPSDTPRLSPSGKARPPVRLVHLGVGAFHRAHAALYLDDNNELTEESWGICGVSLRSPSQRDKLAPQDFVYTALSMKPEGPEARTVEILREILVAPESPEKVVEQMAASEVDIVTLTVTEKGYCYIPSSGELDVRHPDIQHDIQNLDRPKTAPGFIVASLMKRRKNGLPPFTTISCDNLPSNGATLRKVVLALASEIDDDLQAWIKENARFPCSMVDSIVPATTDADIETATTLTDKYDASPVVHEPFKQWVIEDDFVGNRPSLEKVGVELVEDVEPYELMKLRCLNGTHSTLAYLGFLAGYETISETVADPVFDSFIKSVWQEEIRPSFTPPAGVDVAAYCDELFKRYSNPSIRHRTWQIAMDGSQKLPQRILNTISDNMAADNSITRLAYTVAAWMHYTCGTDFNGNSIDVRDPMAQDFAEIGRTFSSSEEIVDAFLKLDAVFPSELATNERFRSAIVNAHVSLKENGVASALKKVT